MFGVRHRGLAAALVGGVYGSSRQSPRQQARPRLRFSFIEIVSHITSSFFFAFLEPRLSEATVHCHRRTTAVAGFKCWRKGNHFDDWLTGRWTFAGSGPSCRPCIGVLDRRDRKRAWTGKTREFEEHRHLRHFWLNGLVDGLPVVQ